MTMSSPGAGRSPRRAGGAGPCENLEDAGAESDQYADLPGLVRQQCLGTKRDQQRAEFVRDLKKVADLLSKKNLSRAA